MTEIRSYQQKKKKTLEPSKILRALHRLYNTYLKG